LGNQWKRAGAASFGGASLFEKELTEPARDRPYFRVEGALLLSVLAAREVPVGITPKNIAKRTRAAQC